MFGEGKLNLLKKKNDTNEIFFLSTAKMGQLAPVFPNLISYLIHL